MTGPQKIVTLCGSLRAGSLNRKLAASAIDLAPEGMVIGAPVDIDGIPLYNADLQTADGFPAQVQALVDAIATADGVLIVSPEYNYSVPGALKNAIDWISRHPSQPFKDKPVCLQSAAAGMLGGARMQYHLRQILVFLEAQVFNKPEVFVSFAGQKFDAQTGRLSDDATRTAVAAQLSAFSTFVARN
jgi:chromate reductase